MRYRHVKKAEVVALRVTWLMENNNRHLQQQQQQQQQLAQREAQPLKHQVPVRDEAAAESRLQEQQQ
jgi:hypothetical protein